MHPLSSVSAADQRHSIAALPGPQIRHASRANHLHQLLPSAAADTTCSYTSFFSIPCDASVGCMHALEISMSERARAAGGTDRHTSPLSHLTRLRPKEWNESKRQAIKEPFCPSIRCHTLRGLARSTTSTGGETSVAQAIALPPLRHVISRPPSVSSFYMYYTFCSCVQAGERFLSEPRDLPDLTAEQDVQ